MLSWTSKGRNCLLCSLRPLVPPVSRPFATTSALQRSGAQYNKIKKKKQRPQEASNAHSEKATVRQDVSASSFSQVVQSALRNLAQSDRDTPKHERTMKYVTAASRMDEKKSKIVGGPVGQIRSTLQTAYIRNGLKGLTEELRYMFDAEYYTATYSTPHIESQRKIADFRYPAEWYPQARSMQRTIHLHVGPTNSGKTYHALQRLRNCEKGFYAGPLRLLAQEVYQRFKNEGFPCSLITGDDVQIPEGQDPRIMSKTVEMVSVGENYEVGVIDEIQMIGDSNRGWAWTRAVLGSRAKELHLCGEARAVPLIRDIAALTGDKLEIHEYQRLNPLKVQDQSLRGNLKNLQKGDCVVSFSRLGIHAMKREIEKATGRRAAIVYGSLPAEIRTQQAALFNDPDNDYDFLIASDAIGMGLNLSCKRIIFETLVKRTPRGLVRLSVPEIKQIAGRAGRYRSAAQAKNSKKEEENTGFVTSMEEVDLPYIKEAMAQEPPPLTSAGICAPDSAMHRFASYFPASVPFQYVFKQLNNIASVSPLFFLCEGKNQLESTSLLDSVNGLNTQDRMTLMAAPIYTRDAQSGAIAYAFAKCVAKNTSGRLLEIESLPLNVLEQGVSGKKEYLQQLEILHRSVILYAWLSYRFGGVFTDRTLAGHVKELVEERMIRALTEFSSNQKLRRDSSLHRQLALEKQNREHQRLLAEAEMTESQDQKGQEDRAPADFSQEERELLEGQPASEIETEFAQEQNELEGQRGSRAQTA